MITAVTSPSAIAFELEQLVEPDGILVGGAARVGGDPPAGADRRRHHRPARRRDWCCRHRWRAACGPLARSRGRSEVDVAGMDPSTLPSPSAAGARRRGRGRRSCRRSARPCRHGPRARCRAGGRGPATPERRRPDRQRAKQRGGARTLAASNGAKACGVTARSRRGGGAALDRRRGGKVDPETGDDAVARPLEQDPAELGHPQHRASDRWAI